MNTTANNPAAFSHFVTNYVPAEGAVYYVGFASLKAARAYAEQYPKLNVDVVTRRVLDRDEAQNRKQPLARRTTYCRVESLDESNTRNDARLADLDKLRASAGMPLAEPQSNADVMTPAELDLRSQAAAANIAAGLDGLARKHAAEGTAKREPIIAATASRPAGYELAKGDLVLDSFGSAFGLLEPLEVVRVTETNATLSNGERFRLDNLVGAVHRFRFAAAQLAEGEFAVAYYSEKHNRLDFTRFLDATSARSYADKCTSARFVFEVYSRAEFAIAATELIARNGASVNECPIHDIRSAAEHGLAAGKEIARAIIASTTCPSCGGLGYRKLNSEAFNAAGGIDEDCGRCDGTGELEADSEPVGYIAQLLEYLAARPALSVQKLSEGAGFHRNTLDRYLDGSRTLTPAARLALDPVLALYGFRFSPPAPACLKTEHLLEGSSNGYKVAGFN